MFAALCSCVKLYGGHDEAFAQVMGRTPRDPTPCTLHPTPYTLHSTLYTLHHTPHTPHQVMGRTPAGGLRTMFQDSGLSVWGLDVEVGMGLRY